MKTIFSLGLFLLVVFHPGMAQNANENEWESLAETEDGKISVIRRSWDWEFQYAILDESGNESRQVKLSLPSGVGYCKDFELIKFPIGPGSRPGIEIRWRNEYYHSYAGRGGGFGYTEGWVGVWEIETGNAVFQMMPYYSMSSEDVYWIYDTLWQPSESVPDSLEMVVETRDSSVYDECYWDFNVRVEKDGRILVQHIEDENTVLMASRDRDGCFPDVRTGVYVFFERKFVYKTPD
jgi:hypothetical protein